MHSTGFMLLLAALFAFLPGCTDQQSDRAAEVESLAAQLSAQADSWDKAIVRKDRAAIEANMTENFRQIDGAGNVKTKSTFVSSIVSPDLEIDPYTVEDFEIRFYGDVALLSGRTRMTGRYQGSSFTSHYRYIDIYVRRRKDWRIVSVQITRMPDEAPAE